VLLLGIDTSAAITAGIIRDDQTLASISHHEPRRHAELLAPVVADVIEKAGIDRGELDGIAVGVGPGPFTGLRIGLVTAQTMAYALDIPVYGVPSMDALALAARTAGIEEELVTICDARRGEVYWARYGAGETSPVAGPDVARLADVDLGETAAIGRFAPEANRLQISRTKTPDVDLLDPHGSNIAQLVLQRRAAGQTEFPTQPLYLRRPHVQMAEARKRATPQNRSQQ